MPNSTRFDLLNQQVLTLADDVEHFAERANTLYQQVVQLIPEADGEKMAQEKMDKSPAYLLSERLWTVTEHLNPTVALLRGEPEEEDEASETTTLETVQQIVDQLTAKLDPEADAQQINNLQKLRTVAAEIEEVNRLGDEFARRFSVARMALARLTLDLSPDASKLANALGLRRKEVRHG